MTTPNYHGTYVQIPITVAKNSTITAHFFFMFSKQEIKDNCILLKMEILIPLTAQQSFDQKCFNLGQGQQGVLMISKLEILKNFGSFKQSLTRLSLFYFQLKNGSI